MNDIKRLPILHESKFSFFHFDKKNATIFQVYKKGGTKKMNEFDYKREQEITLKICIHTEANIFLWDTSNFDFPISPALQAWTNENIFSKHNLLRKCAIVKSQDFIGNLALKQTFDKRDASNLSFTVSFFDTMQVAIDWLKEANISLQVSPSKSGEKVRV